MFVVIAYLVDYFKKLRLPIEIEALTSCLSQLSNRAVAKNDLVC